MKLFCHVSTAQQLQRATRPGASEMYFPTYGNWRMKWNGRKGEHTLKRYQKPAQKENAHVLHRLGSTEDVGERPNLPNMPRPLHLSHSLSFHIYLTHTECLLWARTILTYDYPGFTAEEREAQRG